MSTQHDRFIERLKGSSSAVFVVAHWLHRAGWDIQIDGLRVAPTAADAKDYRDRGDLRIEKAGQIMLIQVKGLPHEFTGPEDWPFGVEVFVDSWASVERLPDVAAWFSVSESLRCAAVITAKTRGAWWTTERLTKTTGNRENYYVCPRDLVTFRDLM